MDIRVLDEEEKLDAQNLIREVFFSMNLLGMNRRAAQSFLEYLSIHGNELCYYGAYDGDIVGTAACDERFERIRLMFVRKERQRQGIGTALWKHVQESASAEGNGRIRVNAVHGSEGFYAKLGFERTDTETDADGMRYQPMEYLLGREYLGRKISVSIDVPYGSVHPHFNAEMRCNYGYADHSVGDGAFQNVYFCGPQVPLESAEGIVRAIIWHRDDEGSVWIVSPEGYTDRQAMIDAVGPLEQYFDSRIIWDEHTA